MLKPANTPSKQISVAQSGELPNPQDKNQQYSPAVYFICTMAATLMYGSLQRVCQNNLNVKSEKGEEINSENEQTKFHSSPS